MAKPREVICRIESDKVKGKLWRKKVPQIYCLDQLAPSKLTKEWQEFIYYELNNGGQPGYMTPNNFHGLFRWNTGLSNRTAGYDFMGFKLADFIKGINLNAKLPRYDKCRLFGSGDDYDAIIHGVLNGDVLTVETLDGAKPPPKIEWLLDNPHLLLRCNIVLPDGSVIDFPHNGGHPVIVPLLATGSVTVRINKNVPKKPYPLVRIK